MMMPPSTLRIRIVEYGKKKLNIWLPMFIIWPLFPILIVLLFPVLIVICVVMKIGWEKRWLFYALPVFIEMLCALKGLDIRIQNPAKQSSVIIYLN